MRSPIFVYVATFVAFVVAAIVRWLLNPLLGDHLPYPSFFIAVAIAAWLGGLKPAIFATVLGFVAVVVWFTPPLNTGLATSGPHLVGLGIYLIVCAVIAGFGESSRISNKQLAEQSDRLKITLASIGDAVITTNTHGHVTNLNAVAELLTGWSNADAAGRPLEEVFHIVNETTRKSVENPALRALRENIIVGLANHTILISKNGTERSIDDSAAPIRGMDGEVIGCVLIFRDIEQQRKLQRQSNMLASIVHSSEDAIISKSTEGVIQSWNAAAERLFGYTAEQAIGMSISILIPPERASEEKDILAKLSNNQRIEHFDTVRTRRDGKQIPVSLTISPIRDESGSIVGASKIVRDISERKLIEDKLLESEARKTAMLLSALDCIISIDHQGQVIEFNPAAEQTFGYKQEEVLGKELAELIIPSELREQHRRGLTQYLSTGVSKILNQRLELMAVRSDGREFPVELAVTRIPTNGPPIFTAYLRDISDRKNSERKIEDARSRLESTLAAGEVGTWEFDVTNNVVKADPNLARMFGVAPHDASGGPLEAFTNAIHPDDRAQVSSAIGAAIKNGENFESQYRVVGENGNIRWVIARGRIHQDAQGRTTRLPGVVVDITRQKVIEEELRASEERRRIALDSGGLGSWNIDPAKNSLSSDERFQKIFRGSAGPLSFEEAFALIHEDDRQRVRSAVEAAIRPENPVPYSEEYRVVHPNGHVRWVLAKGRANFEGNRLTSFDGTVVDITERKLSEELIQQSEHRLRSILDTMPQKVFTATPDGEIEYYNPVWIEFSGRPYGELLNEGWTAFVHQDEINGSMSAWNQAIATGDSFQFEHRFQQSGDEYRWHLSRAKALKDKTGKIVMWVGASTDIHEQRQTSEELREVAAKLSETDHRKDEFLATLAHELRNPLAPIRNGLQVMKLAQNDPEVVEQSRMMMDRQLDQMVRLVDDLMDVSRISRGKLDLRLQRVDLADVIHSAIETSRPLIEQMGHELLAPPPSQAIFVNADFTRLAQVFLNLLNNAAKYSNRNGRIQITSERQGKEIVVSVKDTGIGIDPDQLPHIFELFSQVDRSLEKSQGGLGIGLTLVRRLLEMHGGSVVAKSEGVGKGSEFVVRLPAFSENPLLKPNPQDNGQTNTKSGMRILVVDDNRDSANTLAMFLKLMGNVTQTAYDGEEALASAKTFDADVILLDIGLPKLNGYEVCSRIRTEEWGKKIFIVAQTGWGQDEDRQRTKDAGFDCHLVKPINSKELMKILSELAESKKT